MNNSPTNFHTGNAEKNFFFWVEPLNFTSFHNLSRIGYAFSNPILPNATNPEDNLLFIPNPNYNAGVTPYHSNIVRRIRAEYWLEINRPKYYPSRTQALFLFDSEILANSYKDLHLSHVGKRVLIKGVTEGSYHYSIHDSGWFDFLCEDASIDQLTINNCTNSYWEGVKITDPKVNITLCGNTWSQAPTMETLFYGKLKICEQSKSTLRQIFSNKNNKAC
jgi:hypothetical protein